MKNVFKTPGWQPVVRDNLRILVTGATGGLGSALVAMLTGGSKCLIGAHGATKTFDTQSPNIIPITKKFESHKDCELVVQAFVEEAGGIDALVILSGSIQFSGHWRDIPPSDWEREMEVNLNQPFYLAREAMKHMTAAKEGGRIIFTGTESALHGGSSISFPYAVAKRGTECMVQGLAREGAPHNILVNGVRLGYVASGFHQRWHDKSEEELQARAAMVPLKRGGDPQEAAALITYLLSQWAEFITGQMIPLTGGDWL